MVREGSIYYHDLKIILLGLFTTEYNFISAMSDGGEPSLRFSQHLKFASRDFSERLAGEVL